MKMKIQKSRQPNVNVPKILVLTVLIYALLVVAVYWLMGEQLHIRQSRGNFEQPAAEAGTIELAQGAVVEQSFKVKIQRLQSVSVQWGTYYRPNAGTVTMELYDLADGSMVMSQSFDAAAIEPFPKRRTRKRGKK